MNDTQAKLVVSNFKIILRSVKCLRQNLEAPFHSKLDLIEKMIDDIMRRHNIDRESVK